MTSAIILARYGALAVFLNVATAGVSDVKAQTNGADRAEAKQVDVQQVDRNKMRLELLLSLVKNELRAASLEKTQLVSELVQLTRERTKLEETGDQRRPADDVRLDQINARLETISNEVTAVDARLPEIAGELDDLQRRLDEANGIVREEPAKTAGNESAQVNGSTGNSDASASVWLDGKRRVQEALVYLGGYNALIDGDFGPRTAQAVRVYQGRQSLEETGVLTEEQEAILLEQAQAQRTLYGVKMLSDEKFGYRLAYPTFLLSEIEQIGETERRMTTVDGAGELLINIIDGSEDITALYDLVAAGYEVQYRRKRDDWFVIAGLLKDDRIIYDTVRRTDNNLIRARLSYPADQRDLWSPFAVIMFNTFGAQPTS